MASAISDREFVQTALAGFALMPTDNGASALQLLQAQPHAHLLTDPQMPGLNGIELARALWQSNPDARILFWTGTPMNRRAALPLAARRAKPIDKSVREVGRECGGCGTVQ